jgi:ABC-type amino acid transport substrate-binding protein
VEAVKTKLNLSNLKVQYTIVTPANRIPLVQNGTIDLECGTTTNTVARAQQVDFAPTHFVVGVGAAVKKNSGITSLADLEGVSGGRAAAVILDDVQLAGLIASSPNPGGLRDPEGAVAPRTLWLHLPQERPGVQGPGGSDALGLMKSGEVAMLYNKWFTKPTPPRNVNLQFPMTDAVRDAYANSNNQGV